MSFTDYEPRRARPGEVFEFADAAGTLHEFRADDKGVVHPSNDMEVAVLDVREAPVARKVLAEQKAAANTEKER